MHSSLGMFKLTSTFIVWIVGGILQPCSGASVKHHAHEGSAAALERSIAKSGWPNATRQLISHQGFLSFPGEVPVRPLLLERVVVIQSFAGVSDAVIGLGILALSLLILGICSCLPSNARLHSPRSSTATGGISDLTVEQRLAMQDKPWTLIAIVAALPCVIDGVNFGLASGLLLRLDPHERMNLAMRSFIVGAFQLGQLISTCIGPSVLSQIGHKRSLQVFAGGQFLTFCAMASWSESIWVLIGARFVAGIFFGQAIAPSYIAEISPDQIRGSLVAWVEILTLFGQVLCMVVHLVMISYPLIAQYVFYAGVAFIACVAVSCLPNNEEDATKQAVLEGPTEEASWPSTKAGRFGLFIACLLAFLQQSAGDEALFGYCNQIAVDAGLARPMLFSLTLATMYFVNGLIAGGVVDCIGRRVLIIGGLLCMGASWTSAATMFIVGAGSLMVLAFVLAYGFFSSLSVGPAYFVVASEVLPDEYRVRGLATSLFVSRVTACVMVLTFELKTWLLTLPGTFLVYASTMLLGAVYMYFRLPETAGKSFDEIQKDLQDKVGPED
eukprot:gnl/MRDRNA2_/MRDRNA2_158816_c0_seq1.p1 gnl/MRDRNA2_/MRDRNA2_158816_c0~~gnl/MRDRNA2_/MRDRNA2_158816_c0_seq1.p1  ORF type:complete len:555 (+),score=70.96 gnl/MRDRNA2_/MRDRNA2_158816_c0_seq1:131-1795(+)